MKHEIPELDAAGLRKFAISTGAAIAVIFGLLLPWLFEFKFPIWPWIVFGVLTAWGLIAAPTLRPVYRGWMRMSFVIGSITTPIVLGIVFYLLIFPVALIMRVIRRDAMHRKFENDSSSYRIESEQPDRENLERPF